MSNPQRKIAGDGLASQVEAAKRDIEKWPNWMKETARFEGATRTSTTVNSTSQPATKMKKK
jgi:hypothetical protein